MIFGVNRSCGIKKQFCLSFFPIIYLINFFLFVFSPIVYLINLFVYFSYFIIFKTFQQFGDFKKYFV